MLILKPNANECQESSPEMIDIIYPWKDREGNDRRGVWATIHIDALYDVNDIELSKIYDYLRDGNEVGVRLIIDSDWVREQENLSDLMEWDE